MSRAQASWGSFSATFWFVTHQKQGVADLPSVPLSPDTRLLLDFNNQPCHQHPRSYFSLPPPPALLPLASLFSLSLVLLPPFTSLPPYLEEADCKAGTVRCVPATVNLASVPPWIWIHLQVLDIIRHWSVERGMQLQVGRKMLGKQVGLRRLADRWPL